MIESSLRRAGIIMIAVTLAVRAFGYAREVVVASVFGTGSAVDLYLAALTLPGIGVTTAYYAIPNAFVPLWTASVPVRRKARRIGAIVVLGAAGLSMMLWAFAMPLTQGLVTGFDSDAIATTAALLRICSWSILLAVIEALFRSRSLARRQFGFPSMSYVWQGSALIVATLGWSEFGGYALAWGFLIGTLVAAAWSMGLALIGSRDPGPSLPENRVSPSTRGMIPWVLAVLLIDALSQLFGVVDRSLGSGLGVGAIAALNYASMLTGVPQAIVGLAVATAVLPFMSASAAAEDRDRMAAILDRAVRWSLIIVTPLVIWFGVFSLDVVTLLYQRGAFDERSSAMSASVLFALSIGILPGVLAGLWSRVLYADRRWKWPLLAILLAISVKVVFSLWWAARFGLTGLAAATSTAFLVTAAITGWSLDARFKSFMGSWAALLGKLVILFVVPAIIARWITCAGLGDVAGVRLALAVVGGSIAFWLLGSRWNIPEIGRIATAMRLKLVSSP